MDFNDVVALARAGYTAEQISRLSEAFAAEPKPKSEPSELETIEGIVKKAVSSAMQDMNLEKSRQKEPETVDQILAKIINPEEGK